MNPVARAVLFAALLLSVADARAGLYADDLSRCLVESTTSADKVNLVKWMFSAASRHPAVQSIASVSSEELDDTNRETAELFMRLLTETCLDTATKAIRYEGAVAIQASFQVLGQVAAAELFSSPEVAAAIAGLEKYVDQEKLEAAFGAE